MTPRVAGSGLLILLSVTYTAAPEVAAQSAVIDSVIAAELVAEAEAFMAAYAADLRSGDRAALSGRYDPAGVRELRPGQARRSSQEAIVDRYAQAWQPPFAFEWRDLMYEAVGPDRVVVSGLFAWTTAAGGAPEVQSYVALLRRHPSGGLVLSLEAEAGLPPIPWLLLGGAAAVLAVGAAAIGWVVGRRTRWRSAQSE